MKRVRATGLALVNWKGVFFERYLLDRHVTALEGANGAGKTTVMIAAYLVLLPDLSRLRFTNLGETGATGGDKGIWGRLGEPGRPSYAVLDLDLADGQRLLAGVHLERKSEPSLELTPFLISELPESVRLSDVLLLKQAEEEQVPNLDELRELLTRHGAKFQVFQSSKEYFATLFERGVTPLRLSSDEERTKLNEMLRTSMTGGISRALTSDLRSFLLREETGLTDTLTRMRSNLDACRRTRGEVSEARRLEQEISSIFDAGSGMYNAAALATRLTAEELRRRLEASVRAHAQMELSVRALEATLSETAAHEARMAERRERLQAALSAELERGRKLQRAEELTALQRGLGRELAAATQSCDAARAERDRTSELRVALKLERDHARAAYERAAQGLADSQAGLEELHRNAHAVRRARRCLEQARELLQEPLLSVDTAAATVQRLRASIAEVDAQRANHDRALELDRLRRRDFDRAADALTALVGQVPPGGAYERARVELLRLGDLEQVGAALGDLTRERQRAEQLAERQGAVRRRSTDLGFAPDASAIELRARMTELDASLRDLELSASAQRTLAEQARNRASHATERLQALATETIAFANSSQLAARLTSFADARLTSRTEVSQLQSRLVEQRERLRSELGLRVELRERASATKAQLEAGGGTVDPELSRIRDQVDGELLANRFEELDLEEAARLEAELGPLAQAIFVDDAARAAQSIAGQTRGLVSVLFVDERSELFGPEGRGELHGKDLLLHERYGTRVTSLPAQPALGRRARLQRAVELEQEVAEHDRAVEQLQDGLRRTDGALRDAEALGALGAALDAGDPLPRRTQVEAELRAVQALSLEYDDVATAFVERAAKVRVELGALSELLADAYLLEAPDHAERTGQLEAECQRARAARDELLQLTEARTTLREWLEALRVTPPSAEVLERSEAERAELDARRTRWFQAEELLETLLASQHATSFEDAERALAEQTALLPTLRAQHEATRDALAATEQAGVQAETDWERLAATFSERDAERAAAEAHHQRVQREIDELGLADYHGGPADSAARAALLAFDLAALEREERGISAEAAVRRERRDRRLEELSELERGRALLADLYAPAERALADFVQLSSENQLADSLTQPLPSSPSAALWPEASSKLELLVGRLASSRGSSELLEQIQALSATPDAPSAEQYLRIWLLLREWLKRRVPSQVADLADPLEALDRLRAQLAVLEQRLTRQEVDLKGASEDVARGIEVQLRRAKAQVRRLNQTLEGIAFGSIHGIRVKMQRIERMEQILTALREGAAQELLFQSNLPIEDALNEIFKRFGGGKSGGQKLLDYREYVEIGVEVKRRAEAEWEVANPTRVSTGEAIGVGATLMMVILTEWERDANLLRSKRATGTLRFLFLDEANRLSQDNLGVLFDLCKSLDLQLLIAAPEVARAEGNTTYRLVRRLTDDGREEVIVTGRRAQPEPDEPLPDGVLASEPAPLDEGPLQLPLLG